MEGFAYLKSLAKWTGKGGFGIEKMRKLMPLLGNPQDKYPTFHIGGTNGKGSVASMLASILGASDKKVLLNISPHLASLNERIVLDGISIEGEALDRFLLKVKATAMCGDIDLSHHEAITAAAFLAAEESDVDYGVFEVGLGGRLDASNVIKRPVASIITNIAFDHEDILGNTLAKIAGEKAGIIKANSSVILGKMPQAAQWEIQSRVAAIGCGSLEFGTDFWVENRGPEPYFCSKNLGTFAFMPSLAGKHQIRNGAVAIAAARHAGFSVPACQFGVANTYWPARLERVSFRRTNCLIDAAHNIDGVTALTEFLKAQGITNLEVVFGAVGSKRWREMIELLAPYVKRWNVLTPDFASAAPSSEVVSYLVSRGYAAADFDTNYLNLLDYIDNSDAANVLITGSIYMLGKLRLLMNTPLLPLWTRRRV